MSKTALLVIDFQNDYFPSFDGAKCPLDETETAAGQCARLLAAFRQRELPIVYIRHEFPTPSAPFFLPNSDGAQIHPSVAPRDSEPVVLKHQINCFIQTNLKDVLDSNGIEKIVFSGAMSHMCVDAAVRAAKDLGYLCVVAQDACATRGLEFDGNLISAQQVHGTIMAALKFGYAKVENTDELLAKSP